MKQRFFAGLLIAVFCFLAASANAQNYKKETYENDPMNVIHYTLDNGLQVFLSVNKDVPRIQTYIAVRVGSKNDPSESTGLSHYLEHLMFKGTNHFGTLDWAKEQEQLKKIEALYEVYKDWCDDNAEITLSVKSFANQMAQYAEAFHLKADNNIYIRGGRRCRGYHGVGVIRSENPFIREQRPL